MNTTDPTTITTFAATLPILLVAHNLADHVTGQTDQQAADKALPGWPGWSANLRHVAAYHLTLIIVAGLAWLVLPLHWSPLGITLALAWSAGTHALLDRRWPVRWILEHTKSPKFATLAGHGLNGAYLADQALHGTALLISALLMGAVR